MAVVEFFTNADEVLYFSEQKVQPLTPDSPIVDAMDERIKELFPKASEALDKCYANVGFFTHIFKFKRVRRFCKCNFGSLDHTKVDIDEGVFNFEQVPCPLRGECPYEGIICKPTMSTSLTDAESRVMRLLCDGDSNTDIARKLCISPNTVKRHISTSYIKTHTKCRADFINYAKNNNIFI